MDVLTIFVFAFVMLFSLGVLQLWLWRQDRTLAGLGTWGLANLLGACALIVLIGWATAGTMLLLDIGSLAAVSSYGLIWIGTRQFEGQSRCLPVAVAGPAVWIVLCLIPAYDASVNAKAITAPAVFAAYHLLIAREFGRPREGRLPSRRALALIFRVQAVVQGLRAILAIVADFDALMAVSDRPMWFGLPMMFGFGLTAATSVLLIAVAKEEAEQRSNAKLAAARDTADRANVAKSRFLARMSHELRTPLNGVLGLAQAMTRDRSLQRQQHERAVLLEQSGRHLLDIVNDLLDLASIEAGKLELAPRPTSVNEIGRGSVAMMAETAAARQVALGVSFAEGLPAAVLVDPLRLRQVLLNLLGNAIKFTPPGGAVSLSIEPLNPSGGLRLMVDDTGPGVPPEIRPYLFQDFIRNPHGASSESTGLGLSISGSLVGAMGGTIRYQPGEHGVGSRFIVELPLPIAELAQPVAPRALPAAGLRVLVVDDVASNRKLAEALLQQAGHTVTLAADGATAVAQLEQGHIPDVVLMDVQMPGMDGLAATQRIRALPGPVARVPVIALTAEAIAERQPAYRAAGMDGCLAKPIEVDELLQTIGAAMNARPLAEPEAVLAG